MNQPNQQQGGAKRRLTHKKHCASGDSTKHGSCLNKELINKVAKIMNKLGKKKKTYEPIDLSQDCSKIHADICKNLESIDECTAEACLLFKQEILKKLSPQDREDLEFSFKPPMDDDHLHSKMKTKEVKTSKGTIKKPVAHVDDNSLLSTYNIRDSCLRDMDQYPSYVFMEAEPIDFSDCKVSDLCKFNYKTHKKRGETQLGFVFNTDPHNKDGEHWISMYIDLKGHNHSHPAIYYFDSYGRQPPPEIQKLIDSTRSHANKDNLDLKYFYNDEPFQKRGAQCGMYAIHFLKEMVKGTPFETYLNPGPNDSLMIQKRYEYFIDPNQTYS